MFTKSFVLFLIVVACHFAAMPTTAAAKERKFELINNPEKLVVIFANGPSKAWSKLPGDWLNLWNKAAFKIVLDGSSNKLLTANKSGQVALPDVIVGDMVTISNDTKQYFQRVAATKNGGIQLAHIDDQHKTDLDKAMDIVREKLQLDHEKYSSGVLLLGPLHGRLDLTICALSTMAVKQVLEQSETPIMALDEENFMVLVPAGITKMDLNTLQYTGKSGIFAVRQHPTNLATKGFQWNLGANGEREVMEFGAKVSCCNNIQERELLFNSTEPVLFTLELKKPDVVLKN